MKIPGGSYSPSLVISTLATENELLICVWKIISETCTSLSDSLIHQRADSRSKKNYNPAACGTKTIFTERETR